MILSSLPESPQQLLSIPIKQIFQFTKSKIETQLILSISHCGFMLQTLLDKLVLETMFLLELQECLKSLFRISVSDLQVELPFVCDKEFVHLLPLFLEFEESQEKKIVFIESQLDNLHEQLTAHSSSLLNAIEWNREMREELVGVNAIEAAEQKSKMIKLQSDLLLRIQSLLSGQQIEQAAAEQAVDHVDSFKETTRIECSLPISDVMANCFSTPDAVKENLINAAISDLSPSCPPSIPILSSTPIVLIHKTH